MVEAKTRRHINPMRVLFARTIGVACISTCMIPPALPLPRLLIVTSSRIRYRMTVSLFLSPGRARGTHKKRSIS